MIFPSKSIIDQAYVKNYDELYKKSIENPEEFWSNIAKELHWFKPWDKVLEWKYPYARWFIGGQTNIIDNCLDRHLNTPTADKLAIIWEDQSGEVRQFTYKQLNDEVSRLANGLKSLGLKKGDKVSIYLPRIPEQNIAMLACAKIGLIHSVVFSGFSIEALKNRIVDAQSKLVICANVYPYKDKIIESKKNVDEAIKDIPAVKNVIVVKRIKNQTSNIQPQDPASSVKHPTSMTPERDLWWDELTATQSNVCPTEVMEATDPLFILYTSGSTGKPKGVIHAHGGYMVGTYITLKWVFDLQPDDIYFCTADAGWITGHSYIVYAPLINGITTFIYESVPDYPDPGKWWSLIDKYKVTKFYTAPTAIRALMRYGDDWPAKYNLSSLKILGTVGEPINPKAWLWYHKHIGHEQCPVMDTWWQTETGMYMITPLPSVPLKPGSAFKPFFGIICAVVDNQGKSVAVNTEGFLVVKTPWPAMLLDIFNNQKKYLETYFENPSSTIHSLPSNFSNFNYFTGDSAKIDEDGYFWIIGRNDDVIKVSGHRLGSAEIESALVAHPAVAEAAAIGKPHEIKGESIKVFVILKQSAQPREELKKELVSEVRQMIGPIATPDEIVFVDKLPKTRSGKIMRRVLKAQELGLPIGDTSTLES